MADFDRVGQKFVDYYDTVRGHVREVLARENLEAYLPQQAAKVIDVGGGDGRDAAWLAGLGHNVTMLDPAEDMVIRAVTRFKNEKLSVDARQMQIDKIAQTFQGQLFDLVLSHGVLMYCLEDYWHHLETLVGLARPGGIVSILTKGRAGAIARELEGGKFSSAERVFRVERHRNNLGLETWAFKPEKVKKLLKHAGLNLLSWRGVRIVNDGDYRPITEVDKQEVETILELERVVGQDASTRGLGQMLHYIARKP